ncbi:McrC family protein [Mucilaginibacter sp. UR6-1]|uniref:McrC family protein n=1 Tax=Mucilaginibacter sp. UR6-1 TaxID=1435643 RepID=UPI001E3D58BC|nr:McrC family protein [Mucilaginibacter sp. UR6-1]MCC8408620.1 McrC family protein [Mucilaginibacter sp. UR6-1]
MENKRIQLQEYGEPVVLRSNEIDIPTLIEASNRWRKILGLSGEPFKIETIANGQIQLRAEAITGVVRVGNTDIEIAPKFLDSSEGIWQSVLWRILMVVEGGYIDTNLTSAHHGTALSIPDLLAEMFLASYAQGAARGLPRNYLSEQNQGECLKGAFDVSRISEWVSRPWIMPYVADYFTDDTTLARLLYWSARCLSATVKLPSRAKSLREIASSLAHVGRHPPHLIEARRTQLSAQHQGLEAARMVGLLLLEGAGVNYAKGKHALSGFLWNSDAIYENYIFWVCQRAANRRAMKVTKNELIFGNVQNGLGSKLKTTPDVVFRDASGKPFAITDAKYKLLGSRPKASDIYQVFTAGHILGCQKVSLTYPSSNSREPTVWRIPSALEGKDIILTALPINLMSLSTPLGQEALIEDVVCWLDAE